MSPSMSEAVRVITYLQTLSVVVTGLCDRKEAGVEIWLLKSVEIYWISIADVLAQTQLQRHISASSVTPRTLYNRISGVTAY